MKADLFQISAVALAAAATAQAKAVIWGRDGSEKVWDPARETLGPMSVLGGWSPATTAAPDPAMVKEKKRALEKRGSTDNTCAFMRGSAASPLYCKTDSYCAVATRVSAFGCCPDVSTASCQAWTTCLNSVQRARFTTNNGYTLWCGKTDFPSCYKHTFTGNLTGFSIWGCAKTRGTGVVFITPTGRTLPSKTPTTTPSSTTSDASSNVGAIVGGVVGGIAGLGLIGLAIFLIIRHNKKHTDSPVPPAAGTIAPNGPPPPGSFGAAPPPVGGGPGPMQEVQIQQPPYGQTGLAPVLDPRSSIAKPPFASTNMYDPSTPGSLSPGQSPSPPYGYATTPSPPQTSSPGGWSAHTVPVAGHPPPMQPQQRPGQHPYAAELPSQKGDSELRELA